MALSQDLRQAADSLWEKTVTHPFVMELGEGTLPEEKFNVYFQQDYLLLKDWVPLVAGAIIKAPDFDSARPLAAYLHSVLNGEERLFQEYFAERGLSQEDIGGLEHLPSSFAYCGYVRRMATEGTFHDIMAMLLGIEWLYLDWAKRLAAAGKRPENRYYKLWIELNSTQLLVDFVTWIRDTLDKAVVADRARLVQVLLNTVRYNYLFWEIAYSGESWPE